MLAALLDAREKCANCEVSFVAAGESKLLAAFPNGSAYSLYVLCGECGARARCLGLAGIPTVAQDARIGPHSYQARRVKVQVSE